MADDHGHGHGDIIIIKKKSGGGHGHHGGAWKIAFADFMTAMMAFFLVLWIINASDKDTKTVIARYFNPVRLENAAKAKKGVHGSASSTTEAKDDKASGGGGPDDKDKASKAAPGAEKPGEKEPTAKSPQVQAESKTAQAQARAAQAAGPSTQAEAKTAQTETQLFNSPYEALDRIAGGTSSAASGAADNGDADPQRLAGARSLESFRDPFKPIGPGSPDDSASFDADAAAKAPKDIEPGKTGDADKLAARPSPKGKTEAATEGAKLETELQEKVEAAVKSGVGPTIEAHQTKDGLLISLTDKLDFSMFEVGGATPRPELVRAMEAVAKVVRDRPGNIVVRGHTDARPYRNGAYDNWRLSSDRAQMAYYMLIRGGAPASRFSRVEGYADRSLRDPAHPLSAVNRRLEILLEDPKP